MSTPLPVLDTNPASTYSPLITFTWGDNSIAKYCRGTSDITDGNEFFVADPFFTWAFDNAPGSGVQDSPMILRARMDLPPMDTLCNPDPHSKCLVVVEEMMPGDSSTRVDLWSGRVSQAKVKPSGEQNLCELTITGVKSKLTGDLGLAATSTCSWMFGNRNGSPCGVDLDSIVCYATLNNVYQGGHLNRLTPTFNVAPPDLSQFRWKGGYIQCDNLRLTIRKVNDNGSFDLRQAVPRSWIGKTAIVMPGCNKQIETCRYWHNENRFLAMGFKMPSRNPTYQQ